MMCVFCLTPQLQRCREALDSCLPAPLDSVAAWLQLAEAALTDEREVAKSHADAAKDARTQQANLEVCSTLGFGFEISYLVKLMFAIDKKTIFYFAALYFFYLNYNTVIWKKTWINKEIENTEFLFFPFYLYSVFRLYSKAWATMSTFLIVSTILTTWETE